jgi:hypothetical protein
MHMQRVIFVVVVVAVVKLNVLCERNTNDDDAVTFKTRWSMGIYAY